MNLIREIREPASLRSRRLIAVEIASYLRVFKPVTRVLGPRYRRSRKSIEIDITWDCNLYCYNCNRSCRQAPTDDQMTVEQIQQFVDESQQAAIQWERIRVIGGEPTLHPQLFNILDVLLAYRHHQNKSQPNSRIEVVTNGCWVASYCGTGLTPYGYYPCAVAGGIDRVMGFNIGRKQIRLALESSLLEHDTCIPWRDY